MGNQILRDKQHEELGTSKIVTLPAIQVTVQYVESKDLINMDARMRMLFIQGVENAFESRWKVAIENARKSIAEVNTKAERSWDVSEKGDVELAKIVSGLQKSVADVIADLQKKLVMGCKIAVEEGRKISKFGGMIESQATVTLTGKVAESSEAKGEMGAALDSAEALSATVDAALKLLNQATGDLQDAAVAVHRAVAPVNESFNSTADLVEDMKIYAKTKDMKEAIAIKAGLMSLGKTVKISGVALTDALSSLWEAQRRILLVEKEVKGLKSSAINAQVKNADTAFDKAEDPLNDWLKAKPLIEASVKAWDGKNVRDFTKLHLLLKEIRTADAPRLIKASLDQAEKLRSLIEAAGNP